MRLKIYVRTRNSDLWKDMWWQELMPLEKIKKSDDDNAAAGGDADSWQLYSFYSSPGTTGGALLIWIQSSQHPYTRSTRTSSGRKRGTGLLCITVGRRLGLSLQVWNYYVDRKLNIDVLDVDIDVYLWATIISLGCFTPDRERSKRHNPKC